MIDHDTAASIIAELARIAATRPLGCTGPHRTISGRTMLALGEALDRVRADLEDAESKRPCGPRELQARGNCWARNVLAIHNREARI